ncbi:MAG: 50S ribosome-binding GTPase [Acidimicrobiales bacterium]|nr:50S ribosome-binding GTPase [Acidimicrobiales bacterium]
MARTLLRLATAGSVDDGKSTLLGRLLHDLGALSADTIEAVQRASNRRGDAGVNLALVTDGLRAEREQGITIDVAYRFFATERRSFILADTPGHEQYTRNMVTGASTADVAVVLVDARAGLVVQSQRHLAIAALLGVGKVVLAVNKLDLVGWDEEVFRAVAKNAEHFAAGLPWPTEIIAVPISALLGDNVVEPSPNLAWFEGPALLALLETIEPSDHAHGSARLAVQWVIPPDAAAGREARLVAGQLEGGPLAVGQPVIVLPSGRRTTVAAIDLFGRPLGAAVAGQAISVELADDVDASRGELIVADDAAPPAVTDTVDVDVCWMGDRAARAGDRFVLKHTTRTTRAVVEAVVGRLDIVEGLLDGRSEELATNDLGRVRLRLAAPIAADAYGPTSAGRAILIDETTNATVAAAMIRRPR